MTPREPASSRASGYGSLPQAVLEVLEEFGRTSRARVLVWAREDDDGRWSVVHAVGHEGGVAGREPGPDAVRVEVDPPLWIDVAPSDGAEAAPDGRFLAVAVARLMRLDEEARGIGREISERYEEITLLYTISEILGSVISLEEATGRILREVTAALGVSRASLWVRAEDENVLELIAAVGGDGQRGPIDIDDPGSVTAAVFRTRRAVILEPDEEYPRTDRESGSASRGSFLSVPVIYTPPNGESRTIGVINLVEKKYDERFSAGDQKLIAAIATQVGSAVENSRLVAESLRQERMVREMELAHDLQLKLLPSVEQFRGYAEVAARCAPAESVGGDFYQLFRLSGGRLGVMIGDVSSHGFGAALIMALTMSATASRASEGESPGEVLRRAHQTLIGELENTEMYLTLLYAVIDPAAHTITYSNAGHSHAFVIDADGQAERLEVTNPPFGIVDLDDYGERAVGWTPSSDLLFLFTDGLSDALGLGEIAGAERLVREVAAGRDLPASELLDRLFAVGGARPAAPADDRTAVIVRI